MIAGSTSRNVDIFRSANYVAKLLDHCFVLPPCMNHGQSLVIDFFESVVGILALVNVSELPRDLGDGMRNGQILKVEYLQIHAIHDANVTVFKKDRLVCVLQKSKDVA